MAAIAHPYRRRRQPRLKAAPAPAVRRLPPTSAMISAVLVYADLRDEMGGGRVLLRLSAARLAEPAIAALAEPAICDVAILWDQREEQIVKVLDGRPTPKLATRPTAETDRFELTAEGMAYLESAKRGRH